MIVSPANVATSQRRPAVRRRRVPPVSNSGLPTVTQPSVYFGLNNPGYVVANTKQPEIDYQLTNGTNVETHYKGNGGVQLSNFFDQADVRHPFQRLQPDHLRPDDQPVAAHVRPGRPGPGVQGGTVPEPRRRSLPGTAERAHRLGPGRLHDERQLSLRPERRHQRLPAGSGLNQNFNYVRNSVKVVDRCLHRQDDLLRDGPEGPDHPDLREGLPRDVHAGIEDEPALRAHLRYPEDIFTLQATTYGKYHITTAQSFYSAADAWTLSPVAGLGITRPGPGQRH